VKLLDQRWTLPCSFLFQCDATWSFSQDPEIY
jgi:hypothetical protein